MPYDLIFPLDLVKRKDETRGAQRSNKIKGTIQKKLQVCVSMFFVVCEAVFIEKCTQPTG